MESGFWTEPDSHHLRSVHHFSWTTTLSFVIPSEERDLQLYGPFLENVFPP